MVIFPPLNKWGIDPDGNFRQRLKKGNWAVGLNGDICFDGYYQIQHGRLKEPEWFIHLMSKDWFDFNEFMPIYLQAYINARIKEITFITHY